MRKTNEISKAELAIMQILWECSEPVKIQEVCDRMNGDTANYSTIATLLGRMKEKGAVTAEKCGKTFFYSAAIDRDSYVKKQTQSFIKKLYNGSATSLAVSLFKNGDLTKEDLAELRRLIDE